MTTNMGSTAQVAVAQHSQASRLEARARFTDGVVYGDDDARAAELGRLHELPALGEVFEAWMKQIAAEECQDYAVDFRDVLLAPDGRLDMGVSNVKLAEAHGTSFDTTGRSNLIPLTYRTFGNVLRHYCSPEKNVARNFIRLPRAQDPAAHTGRTMRYTAGEGELFIPMQVDSPRAIAFNAMLDERKRSDQRVTSMTGEAVPTVVIFRSRQLNRRDEHGNLVSSPRVALGVVSPTHSLRDGDDDKLIAALTIAFAGHINTARGAAYRGIEESELRAVFPALDVSIPDTGDGSQGSALWSGYITARNSESGAKSWSISAGLYRQTDGASVACEAIVRTGRHVGVHVAERMVEVAEGAAILLRHLVERAGVLAGKTWEGTEAQLLKKLHAALEGTMLADGDTRCGIAWALGEQVGELNDPVSIGTLMNVLGAAAASLPRRVDARPVEVMLGRMLVDGWVEFKAAGTERLEDGTEEG